jgi:hypothetical protein
MFLKKITYLASLIGVAKNEVIPLMADQNFFQYVA